MKILVTSIVVICALSGMGTSEASANHRHRAQFGISVNTGPIVSYPNYGYGGYIYNPSPVYRNPGHYDYYPGGYVRHRGHYDYIPPHTHYHRGGHGHW